MNNQSKKIISVKILDIRLLFEQNIKLIYFVYFIYQAKKFGCSNWKTDYNKV